ncbi:SIS domain-containing protein [Catenovulum sediminis]|uniref:SIS domain-containing protein n=1 Tax=Catenovulum sediminis TaxID=1740262 RepID=A0ABV1RHI5_9ALTE
MKRLNCIDYARRLSDILLSTDWDNVEKLANKLHALGNNNSTLFLCGNGGSAGNAEHLANDFLYGISPNDANGLKVEALSANCSVLTCLGNDLGYEQIFSRQLEVKASAGDMLIVLSGSGNSKNILQAIEVAKRKNVFTVGILGFDGGMAKSMVDFVVHFNINDMQLSEDLQLITGHMIMKMMRESLGKA